VVAKLLYIAQRAHPDIALAITILSTRVAQSTVENEKKLIQVLQFLRGSLDDELILSANMLRELTTWVDALYAVHGNMRSHTGDVKQWDEAFFIHGQSNRR